MGIPACSKAEKVEVNQLPTLSSLRPLLRIEAGILAAVVVAAAAWFSFTQQGEKSLQQASALDEKLKAVQEDLNLLADAAQRATLEANLRELQSNNRIAALPTQEDVSAFGDMVISYVYEQQLSLPIFGKSETKTMVEDQEYSAIRYSMLARGEADAVVGLLALLRGFPTAAVRNLDFTRSEDEPDTWEMNLNLDLVYNQRGT